MNTIINLIEKTYYFLWGDWIHLPLPGGTIINLPLLVLLLVPTGIFCTIRTRFLQIRMLPDMLRALLEKAVYGEIPPEIYEERTIAAFLRKLSVGRPQKGLRYRFLSRYRWVDLV